MTTAITHAAVDHIADALARAAVSTALAKAAAIVKDGRTHATDLPGTWLVTSVTDPQRHYITTARTCTCPGAIHHSHCKHQLAIIIRTLAAQAS
jgi:uncharacterized Zn finger protein